METSQFPGALKRLSGDQELFRELAIYFVEDAPELLRAMRAGLAEGSAEDVRRAAHSLRGLAANFDAEQAMAIAGSIEQICGKGELQLVPPALERLEVEVHALRDALPVQAAHPSPEKTRHE